jgi:hypothetical protein
MRFFVLLTLLLGEPRCIISAKSITAWVVVERGGQVVPARPVVIIVHLGRRGDRDRHKAELRLMRWETALQNLVRRHR